MIVKLLQATPLHIAVKAIRTCWNSHNKSDNMGDRDKELIHRVGVKNKHASTLEHLVYTFEIKGISRALLQELARHRLASLSVKSTRYTLKELKTEYPFIENTVFNNGKKTGKWYKRTKASKYVVLPNIEEIDLAIIRELEELRKLIQKGISNDIVKYCLPEAYKTELVWTINARSLRNFLKLRTDKAALREIRMLAYNIYKELPTEHKYLFEDCIYKE